MTAAPYWQIEAAELDWQPQPDGGEVPVSRRFGDVYFSRENGLAETRHVFLQGNDLPQRLAQLSPRQRFVVGETGFGTGLNLLALWQLWQQVRPDNDSQLHFVSLECFPLRRDDLSRALAQWPELSALSDLLLAQYPPPLAGVHRLIFADERLTVDLCWGEARQVLADWQTPRPAGCPSLQVSAWFLDGFAPSCNPELWQQSIVAPMVQLSGPGTTFASFSVAGVIKRSLREQGITVTRPAGFGRKREMLKAWWPDPIPETAPGMERDSSAPRLRVAVIGAGIAGLSCADSLARRGHQVFLFDKAQPLSGASGNPRALLVPKLTPLAQVSHHLPTTGWLATLRWWRYRAPQVVSHQGARLLDSRSQPLDPARLAQYPAEVVQLTPDHPQGSASALLHEGALLDPTQLAAQVLQSPQITQIQADITAIQSDCHHTRATSLWRVESAGQVWEDFDQVMVCASLGSRVLCPALPFLRPIRGQVSWMSVPQVPAQLLCYGGYAGAVDAHTLLVGASFVRDDTDTAVRREDHEHNLQRLAQSAPDWAQQLPAMDTWQGRASIRAQTRNYLPILQPLPLTPAGSAWVLTGLGSKGYSYAPVCAEALCALLLGEPLPLPAAVLTQLQGGKPASHWLPESS